MYQGLVTIWLKLYKLSDIITQFRSFYFKLSSFICYDGFSISINQIKFFC